MMLGELYSFNYYSLNRCGYIVSFPKKVNRYNFPFYILEPKRNFLDVIAKEADFVTRPSLVGDSRCI